MALEKWLTWQERNPCVYKFEVIDVSEVCDVDENIVHHLAHELVLAHANPQMIKDDCEKLLEDAKKLGLPVIEKYAEEKILSDETERTIIEKYLDEEIFPRPSSEDRFNIRIGNLGEVVAARFLIEFEDFWFPIYKLRFREKKNYAAKLTDLCMIKVNNVPKPLVCYSEVKTKSSSRRDKDLGIKGHNSLVLDDALDNQEILRFIKTLLYESGKFEEARFISDIKMERIRYSKRHDLYLIHNAETWTDEILDRLNDHDLDKRLVDFSVRVFLIHELGSVIDKAYSRSWAIAKEITYG